MSGTHQIVRFKSGKATFEILTKPGACLKYRQGKLGFDSVMFADEVFKNFSKAERPTREELVYDDDTAMTVTMIVVGHDHDDHDHYYYHYHHQQQLRLLDTHAY
jgi:ribosome maturation protein Sdo1